MVHDDDDDDDDDNNKSYFCICIEPLCQAHEQFFICVLFIVAKILLLTKAFTIPTLIPILFWANKRLILLPGNGST